MNNLVKSAFIALSLVQSAISLSAPEIRESNFVEAMQEFAEPNFRAGQIDYFAGIDNKSIRYGIFPAFTDSKGVIVLLSGRTEPMEKYKELIFDFNQNEYTVVSLDHRGQAGSERLHNDNDSGYVEAFDDYVQDVKTLIDTIVRPRFSQEIHFFAHSMGGLIGSAYLKQYPNDIKTAVFSAPMFGVDTGNYPAAISQIIANVGSWIPGQKTQYVPGRGPADFEYDFPGGGASSKVRYDYRFQDRLKQMDFAIGGPSFQWLREVMNFGLVATFPGWAKSIETPILILQAENDTFVRPKPQEAFCKQAKNCELILVKGINGQTKHEIYFSDDATRDGYLATILDFIK